MVAIKFRLVQFLTLPYESLVYYTPCQPWMDEGWTSKKEAREEGSGAAARCQKSHETV